MFLKSRLVLMVFSSIALVVAAYYVVYRNVVISSDIVFSYRLTVSSLAGDQRISLREVADFPWDKVCMLGPYAEPRLFSQKFRAELFSNDLGSSSERDFVNGDGEWSFVFIDQRKISKIIHVSGWINLTREKGLGCAGSGALLRAIGDQEFLFAE